MSRQVRAHELELFAVNCGDLYQNHKQLVGAGLAAWMAHVISEVLPRFCKQVEPVQITADVTKQVANALADHYHRQAHEWAGVVMKARKIEKDKTQPNVIPATSNAVAAALHMVHQTIATCVILTGNPANGFTVVGPFPDLKDAERFLDSGDLEGWVLPLTTPKETQQ